ncbi:MAG: hypothetical protein VX869_05965 [Chloroflexota bacterium]|nr:hypothetical protein [Chloroflexota bacterium]
MHDGIHVEKAGTPSVTICTDVFRVTSESMAEMWGAEEYEIVYTEHPISELDRSELRSRCEEMLPKVISVLVKK